MPEQAATTNDIPANTTANRGRPTKQQAAINKEKALEFEKLRKAANPPTRVSTRISAAKNSEKREDVMSSNLDHEDKTVHTVTFI